MLNIGSECHVVLLFVRQVFCAVVVIMAGYLCTCTSCMHFSKLKLDCHQNTTGHVTLSDIRVPSYVTVVSTSVLMSMLMVVNKEWGQTELCSRVF